MSEPIEGLVIAEETTAIVNPLKGIEWMEQLGTLDWRNLKPHQMAIILSKKRFPAEGGGYTQLSPTDSLAVAIRCYELGLNPLSSEVWIDSGKAQANPTTEGLERIARFRNIEYEIEPFELKSRPWPGRLPKLPGITEDSGCTCTLAIKGKSNKAIYTAWLSEWGCRWLREKTSRVIEGVKWQSPQWEERTEHMLRKRSYNHALEDLLGVGGSGMPSEVQLTEPNLSPTLAK